MEHDMNLKQRFRFTGAAIIILALAAAPGGFAQETIKTRIGDLSFTHDFANGYPTDATQQLLFNEIDFQRACQTYIWSIPIVSFAQWQYAHFAVTPTRPS